MTAFPRRLCAALCAVLLAAGGVATTAPPASATVTTLCVGYAGCAKHGMSDAGYSAASRTMYWRMYSGHNCTNYAAYRMVRAGLANSRPWSGSGNATNWGTAMRSITNTTPRVGAVAWWRAGVYPAGSAGHVAYVESVVSANEIVVSMDSWNGDFSWARITRTTKGWPSGFIHFRDVAITNTALPKVTGTAKVGSTLMASAGSWSVPGASYAYQWLADGTAVTGATGSMLTLTNALQGKKLSVRVTASRPGYPSAIATSASTTAVQSGVITNTAAPTISGDPRVDSTLTAQPGSWDPGTVTLGYRWLADGTPVPGATAASLALDPSLVGKSLTVEVSAAQTGYATVTALSAPTSPVAPGVMRATAPPTITGRAAPGTTLHLGSFAADRGTTTRVAWARGVHRVPGAHTSTYHVGTADLGRRIRAVVFIDRPGYTQLVLRSPWTSLVRSTPVIRVSAQPGVHSIAFRATVRAPGVPDVNGVLQVRNRRTLLRSVPVSHGVAAATLTGLHPGARTYRFRLALSRTVEWGVVTKRLVVQ